METPEFIPNFYKHVRFEEIKPEHRQKLIQYLGAYVSLEEDFAGFAKKHKELYIAEVLEFKDDIPNLDPYTIVGSFFGMNVYASKDVPVGHIYMKRCSLSKD